jgi:ribulose-5-phosphate 4-epimerase/fuculose-1-phosphate aldolase
LTIDQLADVRFAPLLEAIDKAAAGGPTLSDDETRSLLLRSYFAAPKNEVVQWNRPNNTREPTVYNVPIKLPSVESLFHCLLLQLPGVMFVGHTHVTSINGLLCSDHGWELMCRGGRVFPDEVVVCGVAPCCVPYTDPGLPLATAINEAVTTYRQQYDAVPKTIYLQSHGFIALGGSIREVLAITQMADKAARIMLGAIQAGGPRFLPQSVIDRIANRPDEHHRQRQLGLSTK